MRTALVVRSRLATLFAAAAVAASAHAVPFVFGDLYLGSTSLGPTVNSPGVLRIDPVTWQTTLLNFGAAQPPSFTGRLAYDAWRDRLVFTDSSTALSLVDASGARTPLPYVWSPQAGFLAPTRDGRIFMFAAQPGPNIPSLAFIDAGGATHQTLSAAGAAPYTLAIDITAAIYDPGTNSLVVAVPEPSPNVRFKRLDLSADGSRVLADSATSVFNVSPAFPAVTSLGRGPGGMLFAKVDDGSNDGHPRMLLLNPATLQASAFANSQYFGVAAEVAGCYSSKAGGAVVLDTLSDVLHFFAPGSFGAGVVLPSTGVSSAGGSGEQCQIIQIEPRACAGDANGDGVVDFIDLNIVLSQFGTTGAALTGDFDHDGDVDFVDLNVVLSGFGGNC